MARKRVAQSREPDVVMTSTDVYSEYRMEVYYDRPCTRTVVLSGASPRVARVELPALAMIVTYRRAEGGEYKFYGVMPYRVSRAPRTLTDKSKLSFFSLGNGLGSWSTCLGHYADNRVKRGMMHPVEAYWNTSFAPYAVSSRTIKSMSRSRLTYSLADLFRHFSGSMPMRTERRRSPS